ncbi:hypothetical protein V6N13_083215 [Hibiscus sabdariffa]
MQSGSGVVMTTKMCDGDSSGNKEGGDFRLYCETGGILCIWDPLKFVCECSDFYTNLVMLVGRRGIEEWVSGIIGIYAPCDVSDQQEFWQRIVSIMLQKNIAWCMGGDFNMVCRREERRGCAISTRGISEFCDFVEEATLCDIPMQGKGFTCLVVVNLPRELFDHSPILLVSDVNDSGRKPFRFFIAWLQNLQHVRDMEKVWIGFRKECENDSLVFKLRDMKMVLKEWNRDSFGNMDEEYRFFSGRD